MRYLDRLIDLALDEDLGAAGDITTEGLVPPDLPGEATLTAKEPQVIAGCVAFQRVFEKLDGRVEVKWEASDGDRVETRTLVATLKGPLATILTGERTALNLMQRACGIATLARAAADAVKGSSLKVLDTRKSSPGMRWLSKQAIRAGGLAPHRFGLFDGVMIKDNHLAALDGDIGEAVRRARAFAPRLVKIELEIDSLEQLEPALAAGADVIMLDNMDDERIAEAVARTAGRAELEVSGGVTLERLPRLAKLGVDFVSLGALTHSARAMDLSLNVTPAL